MDSKRPPTQAEIKKSPVLIKYYDFHQEGLSVKGTWYAGTKKTFLLPKVEDESLHYPDEYLIAHILNKYLSTFGASRPNVKILTQPWKNNTGTRDGRHNPPDFNKIIMDTIDEWTTNPGLILVPFLHKNHHPGIAIDIKNKLAFYIDPFGAPSPYIAHIGNLKELLKEKEFKQFQTIDTHQQTRGEDSSSCGPILTASFMKFINDYASPPHKISSKGFRAPRPYLATERIEQMNINNCVILKEDDGLNINEIMLADTNLWKNFLAECKIINPNLEGAILSAIALQKKFILSLEDGSQDHKDNIKYLNFIKEFQSKVAQSILDKNWRTVRYFIAANTGHFDPEQKCAAHIERKSQLAAVIDEYTASLSCFNWYGLKRAQELQTTINSSKIEALDDQLNAFIETGKTESDQYWYNFFRSPFRCSGINRDSLRGMLIDHLNPEIKKHTDENRKKYVKEHILIPKK